jgi:hypothetical protein
VAEKYNNIYKIVIENVKKLYNVVSEDEKSSKKFLALENFNLNIKKENL